MTRHDDHIRLPLVGRLQGLHFTETEARFHLRVDRGRRGETTDYFCHSKRPEVIAAIGDLHDGQLVGVIGLAPRDAVYRTGFTIERLELLGRAEREAQA